MYELLPEKADHGPHGTIVCAKPKSVFRGQKAKTLKN